MGSQISLTQRASRWISAAGLARAAGRVLAVAAVSCALAQPVLARQTADAGTGTISLQQLPNEAQTTMERIEAGGPFPYAKDGSRFGNYERILPQKSRDYYREYTVKTNSRNRGARRIVCGGDQRATNDCYYTDDHYNSFKRIAK